MFLPGIPTTSSMLVQIFLDALRLAQQERRVGVGRLDEFLQNFHRVAEFLGKFLVLLVLPGVAERVKAGVEERHAILQLDVEPLQLLREPAHFAGIHYGLWHRRSSWFGCLLRRT